jgi:crotonobetainyl-CoA:carnitine CoA-transferase CaiB-like acyl-CoA transferase
MCPDMYNSPLPLSGVRVLAVKQYFAGPYGSMLLADAGAEVMKIELEQTKDLLTSWLGLSAEQIAELRRQRIV